MNCLKYDMNGKRLVLDKIPIPKVEKKWEIVIKVMAAGVCGTDLHIIQNKFAAVDGTVLGHEICGTVHEVGESGDFKVGDRVAVNPNIVCGVCFFCKRGQFNYCTEGGLKYTVGISINGGFAEYCKCHFSMVFKLPPSLTFDQAVLSEPLSCITHALDVLGPIQIGSKILIIGAGIIGLLWACILHHMGHRNTMLVERSETRRTNFGKLQLGYEGVSWDDIDKCVEGCDAFLMDVIIDTSGNLEALNRAIKLLQIKGRLMIFGVADPAVRLEISPFEIFKRELSIIGTCVNTNLSFTNAVSSADALGDRYLDVQKLTMKQVYLSEYAPALEDLRERKCSKIVFKFE